VESSRGYSVLRGVTAPRYGHVGGQRILQNFRWGCRDLPDSWRERPIRSVPGRREDLGQEGSRKRVPGSQRCAATEGRDQG
jgi:hypothetical protein